MTVPQDTVLCVGLGLAAHLAHAPAPTPLSLPERRCAVAGVLGGWLPLSAALLFWWPDWSWWYLPALEDQPLVALVLGLGLEITGFLVAFRTSSGLAPAARYRALVATGLLYLLLVVLPWKYYLPVGSAEAFRNGSAPWIWESPDLLITLGLGGLWMGLVLGLTALRIRRGREPASPSGTEAEHP